MPSSRKYQRCEFDYIENINSLWKDMDSLGHINHSSYLAYIETVRIKYRKYLGVEENRRDAKVGYILASAKIDYFRQARHPVALEIGERICRVGNSSFDTLTCVFMPDRADPIVQARFTMVSYNYIKEMPVPVPEIIRDACRPL